MNAKADTTPALSGLDHVDRALALLRADLAETISRCLDRAPLEWDMQRGRADLFRLPAGKAYLNWAYMGLMTSATVAAGEWAQKRREEPWRIERRDFFDEVEACRLLFAGLIGADGDDISVAPAASYGVAVAKAILSKGLSGRIVVPADEHYSNYYAWERLAAAPGWSLSVVPRPDDGDWTRTMIAAIGGSCAIVAVPLCHWTDGGLFDVKAIGRATRAAGARLVVDATQSVGAASFSIADCDPDFVVVSAYKWLIGPYGLAFLYVAPRHQDAAPIEEHSYHRAGASGRAARVEYTREYAAGARRFDVGQRSNFVTLPHAVAGMCQLHRWTTEAIAAGSQTVVAAVEGAARERGLNPTSGPRTVANITAIRRAGGWPDDVVARLAVRNVHVTLRGSALRISPSLNNSIADVTLLLDTLTDL